MGKRRSNGEGSVYKEDDPKRTLKWVAAVPYRDERGVLKKRKTHHATKKEAELGRRELLQRMGQGVSIAPEHETIATWIERWLTDTAPIKRRPETMRSYRMMAERYIKPALGHIRLDRLQPTHVEQLQSRMTELELAPSTVVQMRKALGGALDHAVTKRRIPTNVVDEVDAPTIEPYDALILTAAQADHFLEVAVGDQFEAGYVLALHYGMRESELFGLRWQDIDWSGGQIHIRVQLSWSGGQPKFVPLKTKGSRRDLPLIDDTEAQLRAHFVRQSEQRMAATTAWTDYGLVFLRASGLPWSQGALRPYYKKLLATAGLPDIRFHDLRHSCGTILNARGVSLVDRMAILGHTSVNTSMRYTHTSETSVKAAILDLAAALGGDKKEEKSPVAPSVAPSSEERRKG